MQNSHHGGEMQTPATAYEMNFTPLLPSQLLMGSPFQSGSPATFQPPQFQSFPSFASTMSSMQSQSQMNSMNNLSQAQQSTAPQLYPNMFQSSGAAQQSFGNQQQVQGGYANANSQYASPLQVTSGLATGTSRTVYLGNIPPDTSAEEILGHVRSGQIESTRLLPDKNCAFISFLDGSSAVHFHSDAILKKLSIRGQDIKIGWGKPSQVPSSVSLAVQQSGASRNVYLGSLPSDITEDEIREDVSKFGPIDTIKLVREKSIGFVHFLSIGNAIKAVTQLPEEPKWQSPRRVFYGKDRCAYVSKTQQQNAAQYLGIAPGYAHALNSADRDLISNALAQASVQAAAVATAAGGVNNLGNRTVYLGNIHPETTAEEICNVVRGGLLHHVRYIPDKHICFVTFIDPTAAAQFYAMSNIQGLMIHNRRLKTGWGKHSGPLPPAIALAVSGGASRNVYIGNIDDSWTEERLRQDCSEYGEIELVNTLREKSCAFVNFTNIANAIKAIEAIREKDEYKRFKVNFGKDRCGNPPRQISQVNASQQSGLGGSDDEPISPSFNGIRLGRSGSNVSPVRSGISPGPLLPPRQMNNGGLPQSSSNSYMTSGNQNPLVMYLNQLANQGQQQQHQQQHHQQQQEQQQFYDQMMSGQQQQQQQQQNRLGQQQPGYYTINQPQVNVQTFNRSASMVPSSQQQNQFSNHMLNGSFGLNGGLGASSAAPTVGGLLAPSNYASGGRGQHARAISMPAFTQLSSQPHNGQTQTHGGDFTGLGVGFAGLSVGASNGGYGLAIQSDASLSHWAEEEHNM